MTSKLKTDQVTFQSSTSRKRSPLKSSSGLCFESVLWTTLRYKLNKQGIFFLMVAGVPKGLSFSSLKASLLDIPGVLAVHDLHVWSLTVGTSAIAVHLVIGG